jgi:hypothetical protein
MCMGGKRIFHIGCIFTSLSCFILLLLSVGTNLGDQIINAYMFLLSLWGIRVIIVNSFKNPFKGLLYLIDSKCSEKNLLGSKPFRVFASLTFMH